MRSLRHVLSGILGTRRIRYENEFYNSYKSTYKINFLNINLDLKSIHTNLRKFLLLDYNLKVTYKAAIINRQRLKDLLIHLYLLYKIII